MISHNLLNQVEKKNPKAADGKKSRESLDARGILADFGDRLFVKDLQVTRFAFENENNNTMFIL